MNIAKRFLLCLVLLQSLAVAQTVSVSVAPKFTVSNKIALTSTTKTLVNAILNGKTLSGVNVTDGACAPQNPVAAASLISSYGVNWVRLHHIDRGLAEGWWTVPQILAFEDALYDKGIRVSVDGMSKLGELYSGDLKKDLYDQNPNAEALYRQNLERIKPILQHKATFMVDMVNEGYHVTTALKALAFFLKWEPYFKGVNPDLLLTDCADADGGNTETAKHYGVVIIDFYGGFEDFTNLDVKPNWIFEGWNFRGIRDYVKATGKQVMIQEYGSYKVNPHQGANEAFLLTMAAKENWSVNMFAFATNEEGWTGASTDRYAATNDPLQLYILLLQSYLLKNKQGTVVDYWGGDTWDSVANNWRWDNRYAVHGTNFVGTENYIKINNYLWTWNQGAPWVWLVKGF
jgi:hypothetical protein